jgi:hypothetical protein
MKAESTWSNYLSIIEPTSLPTGHQTFSRWAFWETLHIQTITELLFHQTFLDIPEVGNTGIISRPRSRPTPMEITH